WSTSRPPANHLLWKREAAVQRIDGGMLANEPASAFCRRGNRNELKLISTDLEAAAAGDAAMLHASPAFFWLSTILTHLGLDAPFHRTNWFCAGNCAAVAASDSGQKSRTPRATCTTASAYW